MQVNLAKFDSVAAARTWAAALIDTAAGRARARYLTIAPGQEATYAAKYEQAKAYIAAGSPADASAWPWIAAESASTGLAPAQTALRIQQVGDSWAQVLGPTIEAQRIGGKDALATLATVPEVLAHERQVRMVLDGI